MTPELFLQELQDRLTEVEKRWLAANTTSEMYDIMIDAERATSGWSQYKNSPLGYEIRAVAHELASYRGAWEAAIRREMSVGDLHRSFSNEQEARRWDASKRYQWEESGRRG